MNKCLPIFFVKSVIKNYFIVKKIHIYKLYLLLIDSHRLHNSSLYIGKENYIAIQINEKLYINIYCIYNEYN